MQTTNLHQYFEPLRDLHQIEYTIPQPELHKIVEQAMAGLESAAERVQGMANLSPEEQARADGFIFYVKTLRDAGVSPISIRTVIDADRNEKIVYDSDIAFEEEGNHDRVYGWVDVANPEGIPRLASNNLWYRFSSSKLFTDEDEETRRSHLKWFRVCEKHLDALLEKSEKGELLYGDIHFAKSSGTLRYVNLDGNEVDTGKTQYQAWEEFKAEHPELTRRLTELRSSYNQWTGLDAETSLLIDKAFALLRVNGFSKYDLIV